MFTTGYVVIQRRNRQNKAKRRMRKVDEVDGREAGQRWHFRVIMTNDIPRPQS